MRVAFDVKGTIEGPKKELVLKLFKGLQQRGHECTVWSNLYSYAVDAIKNNNLTAPVMQKRSSLELDLWGIPPFDLAIDDDRNSEWLGAKHFLFIDELTEEKVKQLLETV